MRNNLPSLDRQHPKCESFIRGLSTMRELERTEYEPISRSLPYGRRDGEIRISRVDYGSAGKMFSSHNV